MPTSRATRAARRHEVVARLARRQGGAVARWQLLRMGLDDSVIASQLAARRWQRAHWGVFYTFSGEPALRARRWAALLVCGPGAVLSHETAAEVFGFAEPRHAASGAGRIHVTIAESRKERTPPGIRLHRSRLMPRKADRHDGYPVTSAADTVLDLVGTTRRAQVVVDWITRGCRSGATTVSDILAALGKRKRQRHRQLVKDICRDVEVGVQSPLEHTYLHRVERAHGLPDGARQRPGRTGAGRIFRDVEYEEYATVVELDGRKGHEGEGQHRDMDRDNATAEGGKATLRYGHASVTASPCEVARQVVVVLRRQGWEGTPTPCSPRCPVLRNL